MNLKRTKHHVYNHNYHIVLVTKYRHRVLVEALETFVKARVQVVSDNHQWDLIHHEVMPNHIDNFVSAPPKIAPLTITSTLKSIIAREVLEAFSKLRAQKFWGRVVLRWLLRRFSRDGIG